MARRAATFTQSDITRAAKAAAIVGYALEVTPGALRLVPSRGSVQNSAINDPDDGGGESEWLAALEQN